MFSTAGSYIICYKVAANSQWKKVGDGGFTVHAVSPQVYAVSAAPRTGTAGGGVTLTLGGSGDSASGLVTGQAGDEVKIVASAAADCSAAPAGGTESMI